MRIAHLILAHKNPLQLERLIIALQHPSFFFYIHVDKKASIQQFEYLNKYNNLFFIKDRTKIYWAGYGTIQATVNGIREILPAKYDYINIISAQDFPLKPAEEIYNFFLRNAGKQFITCESVKDTWHEAEVRITKYHLINSRIPGRYQLEKLINRILPERKFPLNYTMVGRSNWFAVTFDAAKYIIDFLDDHPEVVRFFKLSWGADELIFSTILYNSAFKDKIVNNFIYADWSERKAHPKILKTEDYNALINSDKLFARKFDADADAVILEMLEEYLKKK
jgi:hypothetical protein